MTDLGARLAALPELPAPGRDARVALVFDWENWWAVEERDHPVEIDYLALSLEWYGALHKRGHDGRHRAAREVSTDGYDLVIAPALYLLRDEGAAALTRFVEDGGTLLAGPFTDIVDEHDQFRAGGFLTQLGPVLGRALRGLRRPRRRDDRGQRASARRSRGRTGRGATVGVRFGETTVHGQARRPRSCTRSAPTVVASFTDGLAAGSAALTRHRSGRRRGLVRRDDARSRRTRRRSSARVVAASGVRPVVDRICPRESRRPGAATSSRSSTTATRRSGSTIRRDGCRDRRRRSACRELESAGRDLRDGSPALGRNDAGRDLACGAMTLRRATTPPMGWNSWDCYGTTITEAEVIANAEFMAEHLLPFGWDTIVIDADWSDPAARSHGYVENAALALDGYGRLLPDPVRFPSSADGAGFGPLAARIHELGLKFGIHVMRGIPKRAVALGTPVLGDSSDRGRHRGSRERVRGEPPLPRPGPCDPAAGAYYRSTVGLYAEWGVDFIKADDMLWPYQVADIEAYAAAVEGVDRSIALSLSPGRDLSAAHLDHLRAHATMWRVCDDVWDRWDDIAPELRTIRPVGAHAGPAGWPDGDMLPLGRIGIRAERGSRAMIC